MGVRIYKPINPGRRKSSVDDYSDITKKVPEKALTVAMRKRGGRNSQGKITVRHQGGGHKQRYRLVDFQQKRLDARAKILGIEYDPNRSGRIALCEFEDGERRYMLAPLGMKVGDVVVSSLAQAEMSLGNRMPLKFIPSGVMVHNIELIPGRGGKIVRSAGSGATVMAMEAGMVHVKLPSGEIRMLPESARASIGQVSNIDHRNVRLGKAGRMRWLGVRPSVRGKAMNPVDHPHGGGEGNQPVGLKSGPKTVYGKLALGVKTRRKNKVTSRFIVRSRRSRSR